MVNSMNKGRDFERLIAKQFSKFWDGTEKSVTRVPLSGGYPRGQTWGDLICCDSAFFPFLISLKKVENWSIDGLLYSYNNSPIVKWLKEIQHIFIKYLYGKKWLEGRYILFPILVIAKNRYPPIVIMDIQDLDRLKPHIIGKIISDNIKVIRIYDLRICLLQTFFDITYDILSKKFLFQDMLLLNVYNTLYKVDQKYIKAVMNKEIMGKEDVNGC